MCRLTLSSLVLAAVAVALALTAGGPPPAPAAPGKPGGGEPGAGGGGAKSDDVIKRHGLDGPGGPRDIFALRRHLQEKLKGKLRSHLVANGGHEHPARRGVLFMCFETYSGPGPGGKDVEQDELFFGFFLGPNKDGTLQALPGFVELIAWDRARKAYNFYELIDNQWHHRGDSHTVLDDVKEINVGSKDPKFGGKLRCAGCHTLGGPIMKELEPPHNDWWTERHGLALGAFKLEPGKDLANPRHLPAHLFKNTSDASNLSKQVKSGINRLVAGGVLWADGRSLKEQLRSLFTTVEMNFLSDRVPFTERVKKGQAVEIPPGFFVDARLSGATRPIQVDVGLYRKALAEVGSRFPPGSKEVPSETRHAFLVPGRSYVDNKVIDALIGRGLLDEELVAAVLAVDLTTPVYSRARAGLLRHVPDRARNAKELRNLLERALRAAPKEDRAAQELLHNLTEPEHNAAAQRKAALSYLEACAKAGKQLEGVTDWLRVASQRRAEVLAEETAKLVFGKSPQNILEHGFRFAFPADRLRPRPGQLRLDPATGRAR
jgi:hypothetical protein